MTTSQFVSILVEGIEARRREIRRDKSLSPIEKSVFLRENDLARKRAQNLQSRVAA